MVEATTVLGTGEIELENDLTLSVDKPCAVMVTLLRVERIAVNLPASNGLVTAKRPYRTGAAAARSPRR